MVLLVDLRRVYPASRPMVAGIATPTARDPDKDMLKRMNEWMDGIVLQTQVAE